MQRAGSSIVVAIAALGCAGVGPSAIDATRPAYNAAIQQTSNEELLLNIVRLRYRDTPFFLQVSGVAANVSTESGLNGGVQLPSSGPTIGTAGATALVTDNPTVTYTPLQGEQFVKQLLTPVSLETVLLLVRSGWSIDRVLRLCAQRLNDVRNAPSASGPTPADAPTFEDFRRASELLRVLQKRDAIYLALDEGSRRELILRFRGREATSAEALELTTLLGLRAGADRYVLTTAIGEADGERISVETRSLMGSLFYLSQAVAPPRSHEQRGWVTVTRNSDGSAFSWPSMMDGFFAVRSDASGEPARSMSASYRGETFAIDERDLDSKATFGLLHQLFALQAGSFSASGPILTLPVSR